MGKFKKGMFLGGLLGAGLMWLSVTKKGKEVREQILDQAAEVYAKVKVQVLASAQYKNLTQSKFVQLVQEYVDKYAIQTGMAANVKNMVVKIVSSQWKNIQEELKSKE